MTIFHLHSVWFESRRKSTKLFWVSESKKSKTSANDNLTSSHALRQTQKFLVRWLIERGKMFSWHFVGGEKENLARKIQKSFFTFFDSSAAHSANMKNFKLDFPRTSFVDLREKFFSSFSFRFDSLIAAEARLSIDLSQFKLFFRLFNFDF